MVIFTLFFFPHAKAICQSNFIAYSVTHDYECSLLSFILWKTIAKISFKKKKYCTIHKMKNKIFALLFTCDPKKKKRGTGLIIGL